MKKKTSKPAPKPEALASRSTKDTELVMVYALTEPVRSWLQKTFKVSHDPFEVLGADDWTFVIKMHALVEAALNHLLITHFESPDLNEVVPLVPVDASLGKLTLIKAFKLLSPEACMFVDALSSLRNKATRDIRHFDFDLRQYVKGLKDKKREQWRTGMTCWIRSSHTPTEYERDMSVKFPRHAVFSCGAWIIANAVMREQTLKRPKKFHERMLKLSEIWIVAIPSPATE